MPSTPGAKRSAASVLERESVTRFAQRLHYLGETDWVRLPEWARFLILLGSALTTDANRGSRLVVSLAVPTRAYAASLCATGVVLGRVNTPDATDAIGHFVRLRELSSGAAVMYRLNATRKMKCRFLEFRSENGIDYILLEAGGTLVHYVPAQQSLKVQPLEGKVERLPANPTVRTVRANTALIEIILGRRWADEFLGRSRLECVIIGNEASLRGEISRIPFAVADKKGHLVHGHLQDVLRVRRFLTGDHPYRSDIFSTRAFSEGRASGLTPEVVIFDGANSFLRWTGPWQEANWVIVLDRSEARFPEAVSEVNRRYAAAASSTGTGANLPGAPPGLEFASFERKG